MAIPAGFPSYRVFAHHDCTHNQLAAICNRVLFDTGMLLDRGAAEAYIEVSRKFGASLGYTAPISFEAFLDHYTGSKRARYEDAVRQYRQYGLRDKDSRVKAFIKEEKTEFRDAKRNPDPRMIQFRGPVYSAYFATFLKPIERKIYFAEGSRENGWPVGRQIAKGLNQSAKGALFHSKWRMFVDPVGIVIDGTRFDAHVTEVLQQGEHMVYTIANPSRELLRLLGKQIVNKCVTTKGIVYTVSFRRMSGDMNTSCGNCLIMVNIVVSYFARHFPQVKFQLMDDGDDCVIILERADKDLVFPLEGSLFPIHCAGLGMNIKIESHFYSIEQVSWCQSSPILLPSGYTFIRNPSKIISGALTSSKWLRMGSLKARRKLCHTIGLCELVLNQGVPVLQAFAQALVRNANTKATLRHLDGGDQLFYRVRKELGVECLTTLPRVQPLSISDETRLSFSNAFGISVDDQLAYERYFAQWSFSLDEPQFQQGHIDVENWRWEGLILETF